MNDTWRWFCMDKISIMTCRGMVLLALACRHLKPDLMNFYGIYRQRGSPAQLAKEPSGYWGLPSSGGGWRKLEDEEFESTDTAAEGSASETIVQQTPPGSNPSTPGSVKKQRSLKSAKPDKPASRGSSLRMIPNFQLPNFSTYSRQEFSQGMLTGCICNDVSQHPLDPQLPTAKHEHYR